MTDAQLVYTGKAKSLFTTHNPEELRCQFRNDTSAFDGQRIEKLDRKGMVNNYFNAFIMQTLAERGIKNHFVSRCADDASIVKKCVMIPVECVVRNVAAGGLCRRLGTEQGLVLNPPTFELFLKNDALHDPMVNESLIETFGWATPAEIAHMKAQTYAVNAILKPLFSDAGLILVDYKLEFGRYQGDIILADEFSPDGCRIWDAHTQKVLDKDRFRKEMGGVIEAYEEVARRLGIVIP